MTLRPCLDCGTPTEGTRCPEHTTHRTHDRSATQRGYDAAWSRLSRRARRLQPFCTDCGSTEDLTADHSPEAWRRHAQRLPIRIEDVDVVCRPCNSRRGRARPDDDELDPTPGRPPSTPLGPLGKAKFRSHTEGAFL